MQRILGMLGGLAFIIALAGMVSPCYAVKVTSGATTLFYDNFEMPPEGNAPQGGYPGSGGADPVAIVGTWSIEESAIGPYYVATWDNGYGAPAPYQGNQSVRIVHEEDIAAKINGLLTTPVSTGSLHAELMLYLPTQESVDNHVVMHFNNGGHGFPNSLTWFALTDRNSVAALGAVSNDGVPAGQAVATYYDGVSWKNVQSGGANMGLPYDAWTRVMFDYDLDAGTYVVTLGSVTSSPVAQRTQGAVSGFEVVTAQYDPVDQLFYVDALPEPGALSLLAIGSVAVFWRRRTTA